MKGIRPICFFRFLFLPALLVFVFVHEVYPQTIEIKLDGFIKDEQGQALPGATIWILPSSMGMTTNEEGYFSTLIDAGQYTITFSFIGYTADTLVINLSTPQTIVRKLKSSSTVMKSLLPKIRLTNNYCNPKPVISKKKSWKTCPFVG